VQIQVRSPTEYTKLKSQHFICFKCWNHMIEWTPVIKKGMMSGMRRHLEQDLDGIMPQVWFQCPNGHPYGVHGMLDLRNKGQIRRIMGPHGAPRKAR
jgi:hypothetical protein